MKAMACTAAVLMLAFSTACKDRDDRDVASRMDNAAEDVGNAAEDAGNTVEEAGKDVGNAASDAVNSSYEKRDEYRTEVRERLARLDAELGELGRDTKAGTAKVRVNALAAAREARQSAGRAAERLGAATSANWDDLKRATRDALDVAERQVKALRPDAKPMGGTGGPS